MQARVAGGYGFTGHKHFGSLTPVWTRLGLHGMDTSDTVPDGMEWASTAEGRPATRYPWPVSSVVRPASARAWQ